ncbi:lycopene cyclase [Flavobacterium sufflavum]|uniref:Lycopene cyclase n=1 Tax=Flavobacterium sufflavum TaxID=1921138 RepID=A0A437L3D9_9FLAO|nr:lycopene cyclase family protein [Flavobacterium sufflavum]RVT79836.1 lycopene cyclase [Flavobacterium sufflavum]
MKHYNYIFTGTGLATLMTVYKMAQSGKYNNKSILLLDENPKKTNDRTWCFWEKEKTIWDSIISKKWNSALFANADFNRNLELQPYQYCKIQGLDFYNFVFESLSKEGNITFLNEKVTNINELENHVYVATENNSFTCDQVFNSIFNKAAVTGQTKFPILQQHFIGWSIKTAEAIFNLEQATFMDFSVAQKGNTRFIYVLPISENEALIEYTLFSAELLEKEEYETEIENYIQKLGIQNFEIIEKEQGSIPMTCYPFWKKNTKKVLNIGTAGGWTKASTGYTFKNTDKHSTRLVSFLQKETDLRKFHRKSRFWFYDLLLLDILHRQNQLGSRIFSSMFKNRNPALIFKFLDEETSIIEDIKVILKCPKKLFIKALLKSGRYL